MKAHVHRRNGLWFVGTSPFVRLQAVGTTVPDAWAGWEKLRDGVRATFFRTEFDLWKGDTAGWLRREVRRGVP
jgi:hypothetical protein